MKSKKKSCWFLAISIILASFLVIMTAVAYVMVSQMATHRVEKLKYTPEDYGLESKTIEFLSEDGLKLLSWFSLCPNSKGTVILLHGMDGIDASSLLGQAKFLYDAGYSSIDLDMRAHGRSEGDTIGFAYTEPMDVLPVINWIKDNPLTNEKPIYILGISMGGATAIRTAAKTEDVDGVISVSAFASIERVMKQGMELMEMPKVLQVIFTPFTKLAFAIKFKLMPSLNSPEHDIAKIKNTPVLIMHGDADEQIPLENALILHEKSPEISELYIAKGKKHMVYEDDGTTERDLFYREKIIEFLDRTEF